MSKRSVRGRRIWLLLPAGVLALCATLILASPAAPNAPSTPTVSEPPSVPAAAPAEIPPPTLPPPPEPTYPERILSEMTVYEKVCQLFVVFPSDLTGTHNITQVDGTLSAALNQYPVAGLLLDSTNMVSQEQLRALLDDLQVQSRIPLLLTCDEEGGRVSRLMRTVGTTKLGPMLQYRDQGTETARTNAEIIATDMASLGFNLDLAPVADVWSNPQNTVIGDRAYSTDFSQAAQLVSAAVDGFHRGGVACTLKHFPGHGDTVSDSHYGSAHISKSLEQLRQEELLPFRAGIEAGTDAVMLGHLTLPESDGLPILFSHDLVTGLLREEMGFDGVIITDSLKMQAVTDHFSVGEAALGAITAGVDLLLAPDNLEEAVQALVGAVETGDLPLSRLDESVVRVLTLKERYGLLP